MYYISSWTLNISSIEAELRFALDAGEIKETDTVWYGPSGDAVVAATAADLPKEYSDYRDRGRVDDFI
jgi:hypothetical protein